MLRLGGRPPQTRSHRSNSQKVVHAVLEEGAGRVNPRWADPRAKLGMSLDVEAGIVSRSPSRDQTFLLQIIWRRTTITVKRSLDLTW